MALLAIRAGGEIARGPAEEACEAGEDVALLQVGGGCRDSLAAKAACVHGARRDSGTCECIMGYTGERCDQVRELMEGRSARRQSSRCGAGSGKSETCENPHFEIIPYALQDYWGQQYAGWETCDGKQQSPVDLSTSATVVSRSDRLDQTFGRETGLYAKNTGHAIQVNSGGGGFGRITANGKNFTATQFHFHTPSEHSVDGRLASAEMHIVSSNADMTAAVVGILFVVGRSNACLEAVLGKPVPKAGCEKFAGAVDLSCLAPQLNGPWWTYQGSLTTPPCSEIVTWNVMQHYAEISQEQLGALWQRFPGGNSRRVQDLNGRQVSLMVPPPL